MKIARNLFTLLLMLILAACTAETEPAAPATATEIMPAAAPTEAEAEAPAEPTDVAAPTEVAEAEGMPEPETEATQAPTATAEAPTLSAEAGAEGDATETVAVNGRTEDGAYFLGREDAPVTIIDYSDFL